MSVREDGALYVSPDEFSAIQRWSAELEEGDFLAVMRQRHRCVSPGSYELVVCRDWRSFAMQPCVRERSADDRRPRGDLWT